MYINTIIVSFTSSMFILSASVFVNFLQHRYILCKFLLVLFYCFVHYFETIFMFKKNKNINVLYLSSFGYSCWLWMFTFVSDNFNLVYKYVNHSCTHVLIRRIIV